MERIEGSAFAYCEALEEATFNEGLKYIGPECFTHCNSLKAITLPDSVETIRGHAFDSCSSLSELHIPEGIESFETSRACFKELFLPSTVKRVYMGVWAPIIIHYDDTLEEWKKGERRVSKKSNCAEIKLVCTDGETVEI